MNLKCKTVLLILFIFIFICGEVFANGGFISLVGSKGFSMTEPHQRAIIGFHNNEELMLLDIDLEVNEEGKVLRFLPFPSKPNVREADSMAFKIMEEHLEGAKDYLSNKLHKYRPKPFEHTLSRKVVSELDVEIISKLKIKSHDLTVIKVNNFSEFQGWISEFLKDDIPKSSFKKITSIVKYYVNKRINFFVIDLIDLQEGNNNPVPLIYQFKSNKIFYPLVTSNFMGKDSTEITLAVITEKRLKISDPAPLVQAKFEVREGYLNWILPSHLKKMERKNWPMGFRLGI